MRGAIRVGGVCNKYGLVPNLWDDGMGGGGMSKERVLRGLAAILGGSPSLKHFPLVECPDAGSLGVVGRRSVGPTTCFIIQKL
ncbi:hypothetical protein AD953_06645 [Acetobacter malorum]|uniref:Uncharacterized protein n=1 Tax=Acetobacter malorum TaxID=178901 RepID=A0A149V603_9PROT|nr:hypothetical protein AD953_06645 [Acetobacter malorum]